MKFKPGKIYRNNLSKDHAVCISNGDMGPVLRWIMTGMAFMPSDMLKWKKVKKGKMTNA